MQDNQASVVIKIYKFYPYFMFFGNKYLPL